MPNYHAALSSKLPNASTSIFAVMSKLSHEEKALNLSQGYPDFPSSPKLIELVHKAMKEGFNQYAPMPGVPELRSSISKMIENTRNVHINPLDEITVTSGATEAIYNIITATIA